MSEDINLEILKSNDKKVMIRDVKPLGKPRMTKSDKWKKRPAVQKYWAYKDVLKKIIGIEGIIVEGYNAVEMIFFIKGSKSWSKKKKEELIFTGHQQKPDIDNLIKGVLDAVYVEDKFVVEVKGYKLWADFDGLSMRFYNR